MTNGNDVPGTGVSPVAGPSGPMDRETNRDARMWAMFCHLAGLAFLILPAIGSVIGPLVVWLIKKDQYPFVDEQGKEAINFQITMLIYGIVAGLLIMACIGAILLPAVAIVDIVLIIIATIKTNDGYHYRYPYPFIIHFIK
jgi:uncharacterized Tic20 family protein